jgi:hypothetical protein
MLKGAGHEGPKTSCKRGFVLLQRRTAKSGVGPGDNIHRVWQINAQDFVTLSVSSGFLESSIQRASRINCKETHFQPESHHCLNGSDFPLFRRIMFIRPPPTWGGGKGEGYSSPGLQIPKSPQRKLLKIS